MPRDNSPYIVGDFWLDKRRDGKSSDIWQIASARRRTIIYRSTRKRDVNEAKAVLDAHVAEQRANSPLMPDGILRRPVIVGKPRGARLPRTYLERQDHEA